MSKITQYRYEIGSEGYGVIEHVAKFDEAVKVAQSWIDRENKDAYIFDRMARKNKPELFTVKKCTGEAHSNPFIDNCGICMPYWEVVVRGLERTT